ncbi:putative Trypanosome variant surface glycoprotein (A type) [Trypanosoma vivax]|nr:hypothetical protein TRVL_09507 [Trypanosoma vivax]KAH8608501.1 putative Trypanosome variant surface glycoprotein (A type) [Trypanosoma vivax]
MQRWTRLLALALWVGTAHALANKTGMAFSTKAVGAMCTLSGRLKEAADVAVTKAREARGSAAEDVADAQTHKARLHALATQVRSPVARNVFSALEEQADAAEGVGTRMKQRATEMDRAADKAAATCNQLEGAIDAFAQTLATVSPGTTTKKSCIER